ncbi:MAG TPA: aldo/keto reductase [Anaerolineales bacterium]|jgi:aryl-alcohol dehydrogenase-like predicted oxidoreductase|nr:aldo/keto reductase [Anaerolineales bacterium]
MEYRELGRTGWKVSDISLGTWAMGSLWGPVNENESMAALNKALDLGVNFFDTSDAYGSEYLLGKLRKVRKEPFYIATKMGMQVNPDPRGYTRRNMTAFTDNSLHELQVEAIDLMQLHCPPISVYNAETFGILDDLVQQGKIRHYGVSVERIDEARKAIEFPGVQSVMIIFNIFRQRPIEDFFPEARKRKIGILARVPLASGLLSGKMTAATTFARDDHRSFNRDGAAFDKGETFSGVDFKTGLRAVEELKPLIPAGSTMAQMALRWILMFPDVTCAVPGAKRPLQAEDNIHAADLPALTDASMQKIRDIYNQYIRAEVHQSW